MAFFSKKSKMVENKYISSIWVRYYRFGSSDYKMIHTIPIVRCEKNSKKPASDRDRFQHLKM